MLLTIQVAGLVTGLAVGAGAPPPPSPTEVSPVDVTSSRPVVQQRVDITGADDWMYRPPNALILSVWPPAAYEDHINGHADLTCKVDAHGLAEECRVASESPPGKGFGKAALLLRPTFKLRPASGPDGPVDSTMTIGIEFRALRPQDAAWRDHNGIIHFVEIDHARGTSIACRHPIEHELRSLHVFVGNATPSHVVPLRHAIQRRRSRDGDGGSRYRRG